MKKKKKEKVCAKDTYDPYKDNPFAQPLTVKETYDEWKRRHRMYNEFEANRVFKQLALPFYHELDGVQLKLFK